VTPAPPPLELIGLSKSFGSTRALRDVHLTVHRGEVHGLVGQNGSGKSTLVKLLAGYHTPDRGSQIKVDGRPVGHQTKQRQLRDAGIAIVHQDFGLVNAMTVAENIGVGSFERGRWTHRIDWRAEERTAHELLARLEAQHIDPRQAVGDLGPADRSIVAIARALRNQRPGEGVIVLDESTRALPKEALEDFYRTLRGLIDQGGAALMISHNLEEVVAVTDRVTVLRDGTMAGEPLATAQTSAREIARRMLGRDVEQQRHTLPAPTGTTAQVTVTRLTGRVLDHVSLKAPPGEVLGVTGVAGSGWDELPYLLTGARPATTGTVTVNETTVDLTTATPRTCIKAGIALAPEHRTEDGVAATLSVTENITLPRVTSRGSRWLIGRRWQQAESTSVIETLGVRPRRSDLPVGQLSGGNAQKVMLGKWLEGKPTLLVLHEPTQAVDVGAREDILRTIAATASRGVTCIVASIQPADLAAVCNRVLVFRDGRIVAEVTDPTPDAIVEATYAGHPDLAHQEH